VIVIGNKTLMRVHKSTVMWVLVHPHVLASAYAPVEQQMKEEQGSNRSATTSGSDSEQ